MSRCVAVVIPTLNEAAHIGRLLHSIAASPTVAEILVADGGSTDGTREIVDQAALADRRIRLVDNPKRLQAAGINRAVRQADARVDTIVRVDAHSHYPADYVERIVKAFDTSGAQMVATRLRSVGRTCFQRGVAAASNSRMGSGSSAHRIGGRPGFVDHGHHAGIDRSLFQRIGGYDESFVTNEDAELDYRIRRAGGLIWLASDIEVDYEPRATFRSLLLQYWRYGRGRAGTYLKHGERLRPRQMLPPALAAGMGACLLLAPLQQLLLLAPAAYTGLTGLGGAGLAIRLKSRCALLAGPAAMAMHLAWGGGFIAALLSARRGPRARARSGRVNDLGGTPLLIPRAQRKL